MFTWEFLKNDIKGKLIIIKTKIYTLSLISPTHSLGIDLNIKKEHLSYLKWE